MKKIRILLVEDHTIVRKGLCSLLDSDPGIEVIGESENGIDALKKAEELQPDIIVMDIAMPGLNGLEATKQIKKRFPKIKILVLTMHENEEYILQTLQAGALGYLIKKAAPKDLILAIHTIFRGNFFLSPSISKTVIDEYLRLSEMMPKADKSKRNLTKREEEILSLIQAGKKNKEIAEMLYLSIKTIESHKAHIMKKLNIRGMAELNRYIVRKEMIGSGN